MTTDFCPTCGAYWECEHRTRISMIDQAALLEEHLKGLPPPAFDNWLLEPIDHIMARDNLGHLPPRP